MTPSREVKSLPWYTRSRRWFQVVSLVVVNASFVFQARSICFPVLNCWACPIAAFACPLGALQNAIVDMRALFIVPLYILGAMLAASAVFGRAMCGWLCPFGLFQDLLGRLNPRQRRVPRLASLGKFVALVGLAIIAPYVMGIPLFCKLCPQGALQGGIPQPLLNADLRPLIGTWWYIKIAILALTIAGAVVYKRVFCHVACPLGAIFSLLNRISLIQVRHDAEACTDCMWCVRHCPQGIDPRTDAGAHACIRCLECVRCPFDAMRVATQAGARCSACSNDASGPRNEEPSS